MHTGLKQILPRYVQVAPGRTAFVKRASLVPWDSMILRCANCLGTGHLRFSCNLEKKCFKCQREGHVANECKKCANCKRFGHEAIDCRKRMDKRKDIRSAKPQESKKPQSSTKPKEYAQVVIDRLLLEMGKEIVDNIVPPSLPSNQELFKETDNKNNEKEESESESKNEDMDTDGKTRKRVGAETLDNVPEIKKSLRRSFSRQSPFR